MVGGNDRRAEAEASRTGAPVAVCVIDVHGNLILRHRMNRAPAVSIELSERRAYPSALVGTRTADLLPLAQPGQALFPLMSQGRYCAMGGGAPLSSEGSWSPASARPGGRRPRKRRGISGRRRPLRVGWLQPDDISPVAVFLASHAAALVTGAEYEVTAGDSAKDI